MCVGISRYGQPTQEEPTPYNLCEGGRGPARGRQTRGSSNSGRIEECKRMVQSSLLGPGSTATAGDVQHRAEEFPQPVSSSVAAAVAMPPVSTCIKSYQRRASSLRFATMMTGTAASLYGVPRPVVRTCRFIPADNCSVPQTKSLAGVAAYSKPLRVARSPARTTPKIGAAPDFMIEPKCVATATLHADDQRRSRARLAAARIQLFQVLFGGSHDRGDHGLKADM